ncbi:MAG: serine/threonine-protein kinase [Polyangiales bacterium]
MTTVRVDPSELLGAPPDADTVAVRRRAARSIARAGEASPVAGTVTAKPTLPDPRGAADDPAADLSGQADLDVLRLLGEGGMGRVLLARQPSLQREVAVKTVRAEIRSRETSDALVEEARITGSLEHPNIIPVHALGADAAGGPFLVMKRIHGIAWNALLRDPEHPGWERLSPAGDPLTANLRVLLAVCDAVHFAHRQGVIHRDIKPENVMIGDFGEVYLVDWGVATALSPDDPRYRKERLGLVGTPCHMAPEMVADDGGEVDARTDVYLLGATLHVLLTGQPRHAAATFLETLALAFGSAPARYGHAVPEEIAEVANRACARDPAARYPSAAALRDALSGFIEHRGSITLSNHARARLDALQRSWLALDQGAPPEARLALRVRLTECRLGFMHALEVWPVNPRARDGLRACALLALRDELTVGNLVGAEAALLEAGEAPEEMLSALRSLRAAVETQRARAEAQRERERAEDWSRSAGARAAFFIGFAVMGVLLWLWTNGWRVRVAGPLGPERLAAAFGVALATLTAMVVASRRWLMTTEVNARLVYGVLLTASALFVNRVAGLWPVPDTASLISTELVVCALAASIGGITLARWLWLQVPLWLAGAVAARVWPGVAGLVFACTGTACLIVGVRKLWPSRPR